MPRLDRLTSPAAATIVGAALRVGSFVANWGFPHGDVHLDAATARSLASGLGFWTPWEEGTTLRPDPIGTTLETFGHPADQHGPVWPLLGAPLAKLTGDAVLALQIVSWIAGVLAIPVAARLIGRFGPRAGAFAAWAIALCLPLCDYSGNGSLYSAQALGLLLLPLAAGELARPRQAIVTGGLLGLLFLLNYQCVALLPGFAVAVVVARGWRGALRPILIAAAACLAVTMPWFVRNALVLGHPLETTNGAYVIHNLGLLQLDLSGPRPRMIAEATAAQILRGIAGWTPFNTAYFLTTAHLALPVLPFFATGGFGRLLADRGEDGRRRLAGPLLLACFVTLFLASVLWPTPKPRYLVPLAAILAVAAAPELALGIRFAPAAVVSGATFLLGCLIQAPTNWGFPWLVSRFLLPTLLVPFLAIATGTKRWLPAFAMAFLVVYGAFRLTIALSDTVFNFVHDRDPEVDLPMRHPPTFYDFLGGTGREGADQDELIDMKRAAAAFEVAEAKRIVAPIDIAVFWKGELVSMPAHGNRFDLGVFPAVRSTLGADSVLLPRSYWDRDPTLMARWLFEGQAVPVFEGVLYRGFMFQIR